MNIKSGKDAMTKYSKFDEIKIKLAMDHRGLSREEAMRRRRHARPRDAASQACGRFLDGVVVGWSSRNEEIGKEGE